MDAELDAPIDGHAAAGIAVSPYELRGELGLEFARRGWMVRVEVDEGPSGAVMECSPLDASATGTTPMSVRFEVTDDPVEDQVDVILDRLRMVGWGIGRRETGIPPPSVTLAGYWCAPEF